MINSSQAFESLCDAKGKLNDWLREQMRTQTPVAPAAVIPSEMPEELSRCAAHAVSCGLRVEASFAEFETAVSNLFQQLVKEYKRCLIPAHLRKRQFVARSGLVMAPDQCLTTLLDLHRVRGFWRGLNRAIADQLAHRQSTPIFIIYPACGPFAPLLLPLLSYYRSHNLYGSTQLRVVLVDLQPGAVTSLQNLVDKMDLGSYVAEIHCGDALDYCPRQPIDVLLLEAMQHGFSREGHFSMARHFAGHMSNSGVMLPENISLRAVITEGQTEFVDQWRTETGDIRPSPELPLRNIRIELGEILSINRQTLDHVSEQRIDDSVSLIPCAAVEVPTLPETLRRPLLLICSHMQIYGEESLGEYESGITHPLPDFQVCINFVPRDERSGDLLVRSGDRLKFFYCQNGLPGFLATLTDQNASVAAYINKEVDHARQFSD